MSEEVSRATLDELLNGFGDDEIYSVAIVGKSGRARVWCADQVVRDGTFDWVARVYTGVSEMAEGMKDKGNIGDMIPKNRTVN